MRPGFFGGDNTNAEQRWQEVFLGIRDQVPSDRWYDVEDLTGERVIEAYEYGVWAGLGRLVPSSVDHLTAPGAIQSVRDVLGRLSAILGRVEEMSS